jgi:sugar lactone lactonase YvrE
MLRTLAAAAALVTLVGASAHAAAVNEVTIDDTGVFPESITSTKAGDLIIGSSAKGAVYRAKAGATHATVWLDPAKTGIKAILGVFADDRSNTLYVCSISPMGQQPRQPQLSVLRTFDLRTGAEKGAYPMPDPDKATCNDVDVATDGTAYVTDTGNGRVLKLARGAKALTTWVMDERLGAIDGLAFGGDGTLYVNNVRTNRLFAISKAGAVTELAPSMPLAGPDGMRSLGGDKFLLAENNVMTGRVDEVTVKGTTATVRVLKEQPGVTAITRVGNKVWVNNAKFGYRGNGPMKGQSPEPFTEYAIPYP